LDQTILFLGAVLGLLALVPLAVWFATGSRVQAGRALRGYGAIMGALLAIGVLGAIFGGLAALMF
jgi:hypothetical protein